MGALKGREGIDVGVMAIGDAHCAAGEVILSPHQRALAHTLYVHARPCAGCASQLCPSL